MNPRATIVWRVALPLADLPEGSALTPALRAVEAEVGVTREVAWAYADAMPTLLGDALMEEVEPLGFGRGALVAIATEQPVTLPHLRYVQTASAEVCRRMGGTVAEFHVQGRACLEALLEHGTAVERVWVRECAPFEVEAPFAVEFLGVTDAPRWWRRHWPDHLISIARLDERAWLCWDRDLRRGTILADDEEIEGRWGPRGVAPEEEPPPWASLGALSVGGQGWAATTLERGDRTRESIVATPERRWLLLRSFPGDRDHDATLEAWRASRELRALLNPQTYATCVELELGEREARFRWVGVQRLLRVRDGAVEQLTTDHDLLWALRQDPSRSALELEAPPAHLAHIVATSLATHDPEEGRCEVRAGDRFVLLDAPAHRALQEAAGDALPARLSAGSARDAARWLQSVLCVEDGLLAHAALVVDADASVTIPAWRDEPVLLRCLPGEGAAWQLVTAATTRPWVWPPCWQRGVEAQHAAGVLLPRSPDEGDVLNLPQRGLAFQWTAGAWRAVLLESGYTVRASGVVELDDRGASSFAARVPAAARAAALVDAGLHTAGAWVRTFDHPSRVLHRVLGARLGDATRARLAPTSATLQPSVRDLYDAPERFHGRRVRVRGAFNVMLERLAFAGAWFNCATDFPWGVWIVDAEGDWISEGRGYGHFGFYKAELRGDATRIAIDQPRWLAPARLRFARPYVPLVTEVPIERRLMGWTTNGRWLNRLGRTSRLHAPPWPDTCPARIVFVADAFGSLGLFSWELLDEPKPLVPEPALPTSPGPMGRLVELRGVLAPEPDGWPRLDGAIGVVPPPLSATADRHAIPSPQRQEALRRRLGAGMLVRVCGEVGVDSKNIYALSIEGADGADGAVRLD